MECSFRFLCKTAEGATPAVYHDMTSEFVKDRLMVGLYDEETRGRLMRERTLTLESAVEIAKTAEAAKAQLRQTARRGQSASVNAMQKKKGSQTHTQSQSRNAHRENQGRNQYRNDTMNREQSSGQSKTQRKFCGRNHPRGAKFCPAFGKTCSSCGKKNHFGSVCTQRRRIHELNREQDDDNYDDEYNYDYEEEQPEEYKLDVGLVVKSTSRIEKCCVRSEKQSIEVVSRDWSSDLYFDNVLHNVKIDSGAQANVISLETANNMIPNLNVLPTNVTLNAFGGFDLPVVGKVYVNCSRYVKPVESHKLEFIVIKSKVETVLGLESAIRLKFINTTQVQAHAIDNQTVSERETKKTQVRSGTNTPQSDEITDLLSEYKDVFDTNSVGLIKNCVYDIKLAPNNIPKISKNRPTV